MQAHPGHHKRDSSVFQGLDDYELVISAREGNDSALEFLLDKYKNFVRIKARSYFLIGADKEDLIQEGMIGLYKAIRDFRPDKQFSFRAFAELCITRQMITAIKTATRQKHIPLNSYISLNKPMYYEDESDRTLVETLSGSEVTDPVELVISGEELKSIRSSFGEILSGLEAEVLRLYIDGKSYQEIAEELDRHVKSIDNALQRVKRKVELHLRRKIM
ncbi:MAG: RNA polymerase sporulation sigma factor SigH [Actinomycetota bacterium]|nr:RNA polymerase sporulation sigma factor SigH [Actinomycetota bacterium]